MTEDLIPVEGKIFLQKTPRPFVQASKSLHDDLITSPSQVRSGENKQLTSTGGQYQVLNRVIGGRLWLSGENVSPMEGRSFPPTFCCCAHGEFPVELPIPANI